MSKIFTGVVIGELVDQGRLDPTARISRYLPSLPVAWQEVTVRDLLVHTSGLPDLSERLYDEFQKGAPDHKTAMARLLARTAIDNPRLSVGPSRWSYNNFGYELLAQIATNVTGQPFDKMLRRYVLVPAGMRNAIVAEPRYTGSSLAGEEPVARLLQGYNGKPGSLEPASSVPFVQLGAGAVIATADDLVAFDRAMRDGKLLSKRARARSESDGFAINEAVTYGYGVMYRHSHGCLVLQHSGGNNGFESDLARIPARSAVVVVLSNLGFSSVERVREKIVDRITASKPCGIASTKD